MRETEVEEGEARCGENDVNIDPDTALSYIDTRLQHALGHFQKDFEGEVSAETLGPRFGGYGSFLPAYKHPPTVHSHGKAVNPNKPSSPNSFPFEGAPKPAAPTHRDVFVDQNVASADDMASKDASLSHGEKCFSEKETATSNSVKPTEQRSLKVRIKVGYDKPAMKLDEIYGGLGLLTPSPSTGNDSEDSGGHVPFDSPSSILRDMTANFVPGNRLLSPLNEDLIRLQFKVMPIFGEKTSSSVVDGSSSVPGEVKSVGFKIDKGPVLEKSMKTESVDYKQGLTSNLKVKPPSDSRIPEANRAAKKDVPIKKRQTKKELMKDLSFGPDSTSKESIECSEPKYVNKPSPDSRRIVQDNHKNVSDAIKHEINKTITCEQQEVKVPKNMEKPPSERRKKLKGIQTKENLRSSLSGAMKEKKGAFKDIVKVRNSYKDILDTGNGALEGNLGRDGIPADVAVPKPPQQTEMGPAVPPDNWVGCDRCEKWRLLPIGIEPDSLPDKWLCSMSTWLPGRNHCDISEDETTRTVQEMNLQLIFQSSLQHNGSRGNIGNSDLTNTNLIETSRSSMDAQQLSRPKRIRLIDTTEPLLEKNDFVKAKKIKSNKQSEDSLVISNKIKNESEQLCFSNGDHRAKDSLVTSNKIKNENEQLCASNGDHRAKNSLVISVKRHTGNTVKPMKSELLDKKVEIHGKKRKLKDWQESQPYANALESSEDRIKLNDKRLKTEVKESFNKVRTMKIKLSASKENLVDMSQEKSQQHEEKSNGVAAASSSKISGSSRRVKLQERKGSPVGSVSSSSMRGALDLDNISPAAGKTISRKAHVKPEIPRKDIDASQSQRSGGKVDVKHKEASKIKSSHVMENGTGQSAVRMNKKVDASGANELKGQPLIGQPNEMRRVSNDGKIVGKKHAGPEATLGGTGSLKMKPTVKDLQKVFPTEKSNLKNSNEVESKVEVQAIDGPGQTQSKVGDAANQNSMKNLSVMSFLKEYSSGQTALTPLKRAEESKDYADRLKTSGFDYECYDAYFDSALKFLYAASLLETCTADISKLKGVDPINGYANAAKLSKICAQEYEKRKEAAAAALAYKCMEVAYMRIVYCKSSLTKQDLQTSMQMVTQSESPSSSASDVDNLNNQATLDKTMLSKNISHPGNQVVVRHQPNFMRLLDLTSDVSFAMEASKKSQNAYKAVVEHSQNNETTTSVKRVMDFSFQDVKEFVFLIQNTREAINRQGFKGNNRR